jgi:transposase InsO family protein
MRQRCIGRQQPGCHSRFILNVIDDVTKECLAAIADTSISGRRVARELDAIISWRGKPALTEFTSNAMLAWLKAAGSLGISLHRENRWGSTKCSTAACA